LLGFTLPQAYSGAAGHYDLLTVSHITMALAGIDASFTTTLLVQYGLCAESILLCGNEEQKRRLLPSLAQLKFMVRDL
jgi:alkylation response protein AidB-like acyl-CoA dehydrogenase